MPNDFTPTDEQVAVLDAFMTGDSVAVNAGAGTGKTSTLTLLAESTRRPVQYVAFNKAIVTDGAGKFPRNVTCQPDGTMVAVPVPGTNGRERTEVPIETLRDGDLVVSFNQRQGATLRKRGRPVRVTARQYDGPVVWVESAEGRTSRYTPEHPCIVNLADALEGHWLVYMMRRGEHYRIGMARWRLSSQRNGLLKRAEQEGADGLWVLSAHETRDEATLAEALAQYEHGIPGWRFRETDGSPLTRLWSKVPGNAPAARECLRQFGRDPDWPLWQTGEAMRFGQQTVVTAAANLMSGMRVLVIDHLALKDPGRQIGPRRLWTRASVGREWYSGRVTSLEVADDHTYFADGVLTHNCSTAHSLAFRAVITNGGETGQRYAARLRSSQRMSSTTIARFLGIDPITIRYGQTAKVLQPGYLGGLTMRALQRFCQSTALEPTVDHFPYVDGIDEPKPDGRRGWANNLEVRRYLLSALKRAWVDALQPDGFLQWTHDRYLKLWQLGDARIPASVILFDEAQDANPVLIDVISRQDHAQQVWVGDAQQQIYAFTGAINALQTIETTHRVNLTQSFRFGPAIAERANVLLDWLEAGFTLRGLPSIPSRVERIDGQPDAVLARTNAAAVEEILTRQERGERVYLVGGGDEVVRFARAAEKLMNHEPCYHPDLACFSSWAEVREYVQQDEMGGELRLLVKLVDQFGVDTIVAALDGMSPAMEKRADVVVSTAHKAKGREWAKVRLAGDFPEMGDDGLGASDDEMRLLYVAVTRAREVLDVTMVPDLDPNRLVEEDEPAEAAGNLLASLGDDR